MCIVCACRLFHATFWHQQLWPHLHAQQQHRPATQQHISASEGGVAGVRTCVHAWVVCWCRVGLLLACCLSLFTQTSTVRVCGCRSVPLLWRLHLSSLTQIRFCKTVVGVAVLHFRVVLAARACSASACCLWHQRGVCLLCGQGASRLAVSVCLCVVEHHQGSSALLLWLPKGVVGSWVCCGGRLVRPEGSLARRHTKSKSSHCVPPQVCCAVLWCDLCDVCSSLACCGAVGV